MRAIVADNDVGGQFDELLEMFDSDEWREVWESLRLTVITFESLGAARDAPDAVVWEACQANRVILVTGNRNNDGPESLEATLRARNQADSLPAFTLIHPARVVAGNRDYATRVAISLLDHLLEIDRYRGAGRIWLP